MSDRRTSTNRAGHDKWRQLVVDNLRSRVYSKLLTARVTADTINDTVAQNFRLESITGQLRLVGLGVVVVGVPAPVWGARAS